MQAKIDSLQAEIERLRQPVSDEKVIEVCKQLRYVSANENGQSLESIVRSILKGSNDDSH